ncbi:hypothetical protein C8F04DRAFT_1238009 [Mycena alexandri]|uniref:Uncharacterized protein n=1 Tax=Mycena alexandri TaxID=1745969 RepID=A0AAD6WWA2_9AGAR|nr:hypothetical protein C8F04DRAFT_1238009 [Mycena alexandri]
MPLFTSLGPPLTVYFNIWLNLNYAPCGDYRKIGTIQNSPLHVSLHPDPVPLLEQCGTSRTSETIINLAASQPGLASRFSTSVPSTSSRTIRMGSSSTCIKATMSVRQVRTCQIQSMYVGAALLAKQTHDSENGTFPALGTSRRSRADPMCLATRLRPPAPRRSTPRDTGCAHIRAAQLESGARTGPQERIGTRTRRK